MGEAARGIHHVTAIAGAPQQNLDFYTGVLGLRMVKQTVNFDDPGTYHLYYGDEQGRPGTIMTFFPWKGAPRGSLGAGQTSTTAFSVPEGSLGFWYERLLATGLPVEKPLRRGCARLCRPGRLAARAGSACGRGRPRTVAGRAGGGGQGDSVVLRRDAPRALARSDSERLD